MGDGRVVQILAAGDAGEPMTAVDSAVVAGGAGLTGGTIRPNDPVAAVTSDSDGAARMLTG
jgi:hypothetical protein